MLFKRTKQNKKTNKQTTTKQKTTTKKKQTKTKTQQNKKRVRFDWVRKHCNLLVLLWSEENYEFEENRPNQ